MSETFGKLFGQQEQVTQPTTFSTLPRFAREGLQDATVAAQGFLQDPSIFAPSALTPEQQQAITQLTAGAQPLTGQQFQETLNIFQDPFTQQVVDASIADLQQTGRGLLSDIGAQASAAGGFGGSRQGVLEAQTLADIAREAGALSAGLRSQGFRQASDRALSEIGRQQAGAATLFDLGTTLQSQQTAAQQAPISAAQFLASIAGQAPAGGGQIGFVDQPGILGRIGGGAKGLGVLGRGIGAIGGLF